MPVNRAYIDPYALTDSNLFQALTHLANFSDSLESVAGSGSAAPPAASWSITAADGHYSIRIMNPSVQAPLQHEIQSATDKLFDANSTVATFTLRIGKTTLDIVDPNVTKYFRLQSRFAGSGWNSWTLYAASAGVVALNAGPLKTS